MIRVRALVPGDAAALVDLHKRAFPASAVLGTIYASPRIQNYIATVLDTPNLSAGRSFIGAFDDELVGYADGLVHEDSWHLNYIAVAPTHQREGIGSRLFREWEDERERRGIRRLTLDVDQAQVDTRRWYERHGFAVCATRWWVDHLAAHSPRSNWSSIRVEGWPEAQASQRAYEFSRFRLYDNSAAWQVDRLHDSFRLDRIPTQRIRRALFEINPSHRIFLVLDTLPPEGAGQLLRTTVRMERR